MSICDTEARLFLEAGLKSTIGLLGMTFLRHSTVSHSFSGFFPDIDI
jgi:hypothetical protein